MPNGKHLGDDINKEHGFNECNCASSTEPNTINMIKNHDILHNLIIYPNSLHNICDVGYKKAAWSRERDFQIDSIETGEIQFTYHVLTLAKLT